MKYENSLIFQLWWHAYNILSTVDKIKNSDLDAFPPLSEFYCIRLWQNGMKTWADLSWFHDKQILIGACVNKNLMVVKIIQGDPAQQSQIWCSHLAWAKENFSVLRPSRTRNNEFFISNQHGAKQLLTTTQCGWWICILLCMKHW